MKCHEVDCKIVDAAVQMVIVGLDPGETVIAETGAINYMEEGIVFEARMGEGSILGGVGRLLDGNLPESRFVQAVRPSPWRLFSARYRMETNLKGIAQCPVRKASWSVQ